MAEPEQVDLAEKPKKKSKLVLIIVIAVLSLLAVTGAVVGTMYFMGAFKSHDAAAENADGEADSAADEEGGDTKAKKDKGKKKEAVAAYLSLDPPFVVNFDGQGKAKFFQVSVEVMTRDPLGVEKIKLHMPALRNSLILLFSSQTYEAISTAEGKTSLREKAQAEIQAILEQETGEPLVEAVYFTSFVMQ